MDQKISLFPTTTPPHRHTPMLALCSSNSGQCLSGKFSDLGTRQYFYSVAKPVEPKLFRDLEPEPKKMFLKKILQSFWRMVGRRKANVYLY